MRNVHNSLADTIEDLAQIGIHFQEISIYEDPHYQNDPDYQSRCVVRVRQEHLPQSRMEVEVMLTHNGRIILGVLDRYQISYGPMSAFMDRFLTMLDDD